MQMQPDMLERIDGKQLRERLQRGEEIVIVDAREANGYERSNVRPKGAIRIAPGSSDLSAVNLPNDKMIVTV